VHETAGVVRARLGRPLQQTWAGADGKDHVLRLSLQWNPPAPVRPGGHEVEHAAWSGRLEGFRSHDYVEGREDPEPPAPWLDTVAEYAKLTLLTANDDSGARIALDGSAERVRSLLASRFAAVGPAATFDLTLVDAPAGTGVGSDGALPDGARRIGHARLQLVPGTWACATAYDERSVLHDWDVEVAQASRIPDPKLVRVQHGMFVNARVADGVLEVDGEWSWRDADVVQDAALSAAVQTPELVNARRSGEHAVAEKVPAVLLPPDRVRIEQPVRLRMPFAARLPLRQDAPVVARQAAAAFGQGRELLLVARPVE
jgi:hypothetical protein